MLEYLVMPEVMVETLTVKQKPKVMKQKPKVMVLVVLLYYTRHKEVL